MGHMTGAELTIRLLERQGVTGIAGIPGGCNLPLYDALYKSSRITHILARHEQGAGFIAQGMARTSGLPAVFFATSGPGATNTLTALADAKLDSVPIICITGQVPLSLIGTDAFQEIDIYGMSVPATKHNFLVRSIEELANVIPLAFSIAASGRPGPVLIDIPKDVQCATIDLDNFALPEPGRAEAPLQPDTAQLAQAAQLLNASKRPILLFGGGTANPKAADAALILVERYRLPAAMSLQGLGVIPVEHELSLGMLGMHAARFTNLLVQECDLLLVAGGRFDDRATGLLDQFCPDAKVIHIDIDAGEMGKLRAPDVGLVADAALALEGLTPLLKQIDRSPWLHRMAALKSEHGMQLDRADDPLSPYGIVRCSAQLAKGETIVATDVGQHQMRTAQAYPFAGTRRWLTSGGLGTMGFGLPAAIGAAIARPKATVLCFSGDGSLLMNIQELATAADLGVNVKILLCNNQGLGLVQQQQDLFYGGRVFASAYPRPTNFVRIAEGFGIPAITLSTSSDPMADLHKALNTPGPCLIEVKVSAEDKVFPMVPPGAANVEMIGGEHHDR